MKRRCGTCRFYSGDEHAAGGRCLHPERVDAGLGFTVRATELNCRSGWDKDLWEQRPEQRLTADGVPTAQPGQVGGEPPAANATGPATLAERESEAGVDVLVDVAHSSQLVIPEAPAGSSTSQRQSSSSASMPPGDAANDRASIRRARDVQRLRLANRTRPALALTPSRVEPGLDEVLAAAAADPIAVTAEDADAAAPEPELVAASDPPSNQAETVLVDTPIVAEASGRERAWAARMAELGPVPPVPVAEMRPDVLGWGANRREAEDRFDTIPAIDPDFRLPFRERTQTTRLRAGFDDADVPNREWDGSRATGRQDEPQPRTDEAPSSPPRDLDAMAVGRRWMSDRQVARERATPPEAHQSTVMTDSLANRADDSVAIPEDQANAETEAVTYWSERPFAPSSFEADSGEGLGEGPALWAEEVAPAVDPAADVPSSTAAPSYKIDAGSDLFLVDQIEEEVDDPYATWLVDHDQFADVPRCCRTCREFRPTEGGERGWCTSAWAFQHRRMVHADELPCSSAIGIWWLPSDDVWLDDLDFDHAEPTPFIDTMLARRATIERPASRVRRRGRQ